MIETILAQRLNLSLILLEKPLQHFLNLLHGSSSRVTLDLLAASLTGLYGNRSVCFEVKWPTAGFYVLITALGFIKGYER